MLIIDADLYVYKIGFSYRKQESDEELLPLPFYLHSLDLSLNKLLDNFPDHSYKLFITSSDQSNYRFKIATITPYKGGRRKCSKCKIRCKSEFDRDKISVLICNSCGIIDKDNTYADKPGYYDELRSHLVNKWGAEIVYNQEADDAVSIEAMKHLNSVMVHIDKDINNTPGIHYNPDIEETYAISYEQAVHNFYTQFLLGDNIDCIPGVRGIGKSIAKKIFSIFLENIEYEKILMDIFQGNYKIKGWINRMRLTEEKAYDRLKEIGQLLWIRREENELWQPAIETMYSKENMQMKHGGESMNNG